MRLTRHRRRPSPPDAERDGARADSSPPLRGGAVAGRPAGNYLSSAAIMASAMGALEAGFWPVNRFPSCTL